MQKKNQNRGNLELFRIIYLSICYNFFKINNVLKLNLINMLIIKKIYKKNIVGEKRCKVKNCKKNIKF